MSERRRSAQPAEDEEFDPFAEPAEGETAVDEAPAAEADEISEPLELDEAEADLAVGGEDEDPEADESLAADESALREDDSAPAEPSAAEEGAEAAGGGEVLAVEFLVTPVAEAIDRAERLGRPIMVEIAVGGATAAVEEEVAPRVPARTTRTARTERRSGRSRREAVELDPVRAEAQRRAKRKAMFIIHGGMLFLFLLCAAAGTYKVPLLLGHEPIWPWSVILPALFPEPTEPAFDTSAHVNEVDNKTLQLANDDLKRAESMWNEGGREKEAFALLKDTHRQVREVLEAVDREIKDGSRQNAQGLQNFAKALDKDIRNKIKVWGKEVTDAAPADDSAQKTDENGAQ